MGGDESLPKFFEVGAGTGMGAPLEGRGEVPEAVVAVVTEEEADDLAGDLTSFVVSDPALQRFEGGVEDEGKVGG